MDEVDADPDNRRMVDPMDAFLARQRRNEEAMGIFHVAQMPDEPPDDVELLPLHPGLIVPIDVYRESVPTEIPWRCRPIAYSGGVTLIAGSPKAGKSTLAAQLQRCCETGQDFLGEWHVEPSPVLLVTEEGGVAVVHKTDGMHQLEVLDRKAALAAGLDFKAVLAVIHAWVLDHPNALVFIDTLAIWGEIENENDAGEANRAVAAVTALAQATDSAIVLIHHARKSGGENGDAIRGSGAILATVDIAVELTRVRTGSDARWLDIQGRVILPERLQVSFDRLSMTYLIDHDADPSVAIDAELADIPSDGGGLSRDDIRVLWKRDPRKRLDELFEMGRVRREYEKVGRVWTYRYWSVPSTWIPVEEDDDGRFE